jgi:hypothetical protein
MIPLVINVSIRLIIFGRRDSKKATSPNNKLSIMPTAHIERKM